MNIHQNILDQVNKLRLKRATTLSPRPVFNNSYLFSLKPNSIRRAVLSTNVNYLSTPPQTVDSAQDQALAYVESGYVQSGYVENTI